MAHLFKWAGSASPFSLRSKGEAEPLCPKAFYRINDTLPERLGRFDDCVRQDGGMTIEEFCRDEGISQSSFYNWRRKLARSKKRRPSARKRQKKKKSANGRGAFEPVMIAAATTTMATTATVHVRLPGDILIEVPTGSENALRAIVDQLVRNEREADQC